MRTGVGHIEIGASSFMRYQTQDRSARRISPTTSYDCELPPNVRAELEVPPPRRPQILEKPAPDPAFRSRLVLALLAILMVVGGFVMVLTQPPRVTQEKPAVQPSPIPVPVVQPTPVQSPIPPVPTPERLEPAPAPVAQPEVRRAELVTRRAELVSLPAPRAKLVAIPLGSWTQLIMPDGSREYALFRGVVPSGSMLPAAGAPGDLYIAGDTGYAWVWIPEANGGSGGWIDP